MFYGNNTDNENIKQCVVTTVAICFDREKFHCCRKKPCISCTSSYLFWLWRMSSSVLRLCFWEVQR